MKSILSAFRELGFCAVWSLLEICTTQIIEVHMDPNLYTKSKMLISKTLETLDILNPRVFRGVEQNRHLFVVGTDEVEHETPVHQRQ